MSSLAASERTKKYDIPVGHLDYSYIRDCNDTKELEKIIRVLRSGDEGIYPQLEECAEKRLSEIDPKSRLLWKSKPVSTPRDLEKSEWEDIIGDLNTWTSEMSSADQSRKQQNVVDEEEDKKLPPVRGQARVVPTTKNPVTSSAKASKKKRVKPRDYNDWDKFDIDAELAKVEDKEAKKEEKAKNILQKPSKPCIPATVDCSGLPEEEKVKRADLEKNKGNEAFKVDDYEEALLYYSRSLSLKPTVAAHNNRAQTYIKTKQWNKALGDCQAVLKMEPGNLKALLRRAVAFQGRNELVQAKEDIMKVLKREPQNKRAKEILEQIEASLKVQKTKGRRMVIDEVDGSSGSDDERLKDSLTSKGQQSGEPTVNGAIDPETCSEKRESDQGVGRQPSRTESDRLQQPSRGETEASRETEKPHQQQQQPLGTKSKPDSPSPTGHKGKGNKRKKKGKGHGQNTKPQTPREDDKIVPGSKPHKSPEVLRLQKTVAENGSVGFSEKQDTKSSTSEAKHKRQDINKIKVPTPSALPENKGSPEAPAVQTAVPTEVPAADVHKPQPPLPSDVSDLKTAGNDLFKVGQYGEAIAQYSKAIDKLGSKGQREHTANTSLLYSNRAACKLKVGDCEGGIRDCNSSLELNPGSLKPLIRRAQAYETMEKYRKAYSDYRQALYIDGQVDVALLGVNRCMKMLQQIDGPKWRDKLPSVTVPTLPASAPVTPATVPTLPASASVTPVTAPTTSQTTGTTVPATKPSQSPEEIFEKAKTEGNTFVQKADFEAAVSCYSRCVEAIPDRCVAYTNRALCYLRLNKPLDVLKDCDKALQLEAGNVKALFRRAQAYKMLERYDESFFDLAALLKKDPKNTAARREFQVVIGYREEAKKARQAADKQPVKGNEKKRQRLKIQEVEDSSDDEDIKEAAQPEPVRQQKDIHKDASKASPSSSKPHIKPDSKPNHGPDTKKKQDTSKETAKVKNTSSPKSDSTDNQQKESTKDDKTPVESKTTAAATETSSQTGSKGGASDQTLMSKSPYEFVQAWSSLKPSNGPAPYAKLLEQIKPEQLPKVISNKLDGDMLHMIIQCVELFIDREQLSSGVTLKSPSDLVTMATGMSSRSLAYLQNLTKVPRFKTITMFMGEGEKKDLKRVLDKLAAQGTCTYLQQDLRNLRKAYEL